MLSNLQEQILHLALKERFVTSDEILRAIWGFQPQEWGAKKATIGEREYARAHASLSRSLTRLWQRNLITYWKNLTGYKTGISLTPERETLAQAILAEAENQQ